MESPALIGCMPKLLGPLSALRSGMSLRQICCLHSSQKAGTAKSQHSDVFNEIHAIQDVLDKCSSKIKCLACLSLADGDDLLPVATSKGALSDDSHLRDTGQHLALHTVAARRAWLSTVDEDEAIQILMERGLSIPTRCHSPVIASEATLRAELRATRARGYGLAIDEVSAGSAAMAFPLPNAKDRNGRAVGAISVAGPIFRMSQPRTAEIISDVRSAIAELSKIWPETWSLKAEQQWLNRNQ
jgi:IclR family transcriptional regulator, acetate operon repressor